MMFAASGVENFYLSQGVLGITVIVLAAVVIFLYKKTDTLQNKIDTIQEQRLQSTLETRDKLVEPMDQMKRLIENMYELLLRSGK